MAEQMATPANVWRRARERGFPFKLPSGRIARLCPAPLDRIMQSGEVPNLLLPIVSSVLWAQVGVQAELNEVELEAAERKYMLELCALIVPLALVYPRVVDNPAAEDEIHIDDLDFGDKQAIYTVAKLPAEVLGKFCLQQNVDVAPLPAVQTLGDEPIEGAQD